MLHIDLIAPIPELLRRQAAARGSKCAFRDAQTALTYAELCDRTGKLAGHLGDNGIATGDAVAVMLPNSVAWVESCFAITRAGGVGVPIPYDATEAEISYRLTDADCKAVITTGERGDLFARTKNAAPNLKTIVVTDRGSCEAKALHYAELIDAQPKSLPCGPGLTHETASIPYTDGTTGRPTGPGMLWGPASGWTRITGLSERDTVLSRLPLFHSYALNLSVMSILAAV